MVLELRLVMGMTAPLYARIAPLLTIYSRTPWVDVDAAPPGVLAVLGSQGEAAATAGRGAVKLGHAFTIIAELRGPQFCARAPDRGRPADRIARFGGAHLSLELIPVAVPVDFDVIWSGSMGCDLLL